MKQQLEDYSIYLNHIPLKCDNTSAINLTKNPIMHSRTKHIEIRHHFLRDHISKGNYVIDYVDTKHQLADIFTKPLAKNRFYELIRDLGILKVSWKSNDLHFSYFRKTALNNQLSLMIIDYLLPK